MRKKIDPDNRIVIITDEPEPEPSLKKIVGEEQERRRNLQVQVDKMAATISDMDKRINHLERECNVISNGLSILQEDIIENTGRTEELIQSLSVKNSQDKLDSLAKGIESILVAIRENKDILLAMKGY